MRVSGEMRRLLTVGEAAAYLGVARKTLYNRASARQISTVKIGRSLRFDVHDLDTYIEVRRRPAILDLGVGKRPHGGAV